MPEVFDLIGDSVSPTEFITIGIGHPKVFDNVGEFINVLESVTVEISTGIAVVVTDDVGETDAVAVQISVNVVVADDAVATEVIDVRRSSLVVEVFDDAPATEAVQLRDELAVVDDVPVSEFVDARMPIPVVVADDAAPAEYVNTTPSLQISVFDDNTFPPLEPPPMPATGIARDYVDVAEGLEMGLGLPVVVGDDVSVDEAVAIALPLPVLAVDVLAPVDALDATSITVQPLFATAADVVTPADVVTMAPTVTVAVADVVGPTEAVQVSLPLEAEVSEAGTPTEAVDVRTGALLVAVADDDVPADFVAGELSVLLLGVMDLLTLEDVAGSLIPMAIQVVDEPVGAEDFAIGERRRVTSGFLDDLHFIDDDSQAAAVAGGAVTRRS